MMARVAALALGLVLSTSSVAVAQRESPGSTAHTLAGALELLAETLTETADWQPTLTEPPMARIVRSGPRSSGAVALTFDDGFNLGACTRIADTLREHGATGTFFINGNHLKAQPEKWRRVLEGMPVANHTRSHLNLTDQVHRVVRKQIREDEAVHERVLGRPMLKLLRPPYGASGDRIRRIAAELGYDRIVLWSVDTQDWKRSSRSRAIARRAKGAPPGSIILMHCSRAATATALPSIIRHYQRRGIKVAGLDEVLRP